MARLLFTMHIANDLGLPTRMVPIARELADRGHTVAVCNPSPAPARLIGEAGLPNLPLPPLPRPALPERTAGRYREEDEFWVADCLVCKTPMIVWRRHGLPHEALETELLRQLEEVAAERFGDGGYWIDRERRRIPDHWHAHARPEGGFFGS